jgi:uncharacterized membrane protein
MSDQDQDRAQGAGESSPSTETGSPSGTRTNEDGQSGATAVKDTAGKAKEALKTAAQAPSTDFKTVLRDAQRIIADEVKAGLTQVATETVAPAARQAATSALISATTKAPGLLENAVKTTLAPKLKEAGGAKAIAGTVLSKFPGVITKVPGALSKLPAAGGLGSMLGKVGGGGGGGGDGGDGGDDLKGTGRGRRLPMQAAIDVSVPVEVAYDQWTQFEDFPKFMFRVERIEQKDDTHLIWHEKIWGIRRQWEAEIVEQRPNERIVWRSTSGPQNVGVINFHRKHDPRLSRVQVNLDFQPTGLIEKTGRGWRHAIRALDTDLQRFKAYVEMKDAATGAWRGRIKDAEVQGEEPEQGEQEPTEGQPSEGGRAEAEAPPEGDRQPEGEQPQPQAAETESSASREPEPSGDGGPPSAQESDEEEAGDPVVSKRRGRKG